MRKHPCVPADFGRSGVFFAFTVVNLSRIQDISMRCTCVVGLQWGDEAKGKIVDLLTEQHDFVVRYNGGANAGHTVVSGDQKLQAVAAADRHPAAPGAPRSSATASSSIRSSFSRKSAALRKAGVAVTPRAACSSATMPTSSSPTTPTRKILREKAARNAIGTTGRGIGPCYQDKVGRTHGIRVGELLDEARLRERLREVLAWKNRV